MSKATYLLKNTGILAIGNFSSKILIFLLVPLYTAVLSTDEYAMYDLIVNSINLLLPILTLNIADSVLRFPLDKNADDTRIIHIGICFTFTSSLILVAIQFLPNAPWSALDGIVWLSPLYFALAFNQLLQLFARGMERFSDVAIAGVVGTITTVTLNILLLVVFPLGLNGFFLANIFGQFLPCTYLLIRLRSYIFSKTTTSDPNHKLLKSMIMYSIPLAVNTVSWWVVNTSDVYIVAAICGFEATGMYSIAYKIPSILNILQAIFLQAWQVSAVIDFDKNDTDGFLRKSYSMIQAAVALSCSLLIATTPLLAHLMFSNDFYTGWIYVPCLLIYATCNTMSGILGGFYGAVKDTISLTISVVLGALVNMLGGLVLVMMIGPMGAAVSSLLSGLTTWLYRVIAIKKHMTVSFGIPKSFLIYGLLTIQAILLLCNLPLYVRIASQCTFVIILSWIFKQEIATCFKSLKKAIRKRRNRHPKR